MSDASDFLSDLDSELADSGENIILRRKLTGADPVDVTCRASVRNYGADELVPPIAQGQSEVILSSTQIIAANWPGASPTTRDNRVPIKDDKIWIQGLWRTVEAAMPKYIGGVLVRITLRVLAPT